MVGADPRGAAVRYAHPTLPHRPLTGRERSGSAFGNTGYTLLMAKVMISLPNDLLARVDAHASEHGSTRSATIRELAEVGLGERQRRLAQRMAELEGHAQGHGGNVAQQIRASRPA